MWRYDVSRTLLAHSDPSALKKLIHDNGDGTYTVTFHQRDPKTHQFKAVPVKVDADLYTSNTSDTPPQQLLTYDSPVPPSWSDHAQTPKLWGSLIEKAYAQYKGGSYEDIGNGGWPHNALADLLGRPSHTFHTSKHTSSQVWSSIQKAVDSKSPICASTSISPSQQAKYTNSGLVGSHAYAVTGYELKNGVHYVKLRNPWGNTEPGFDGKDDGNFELPLAKFMKYFDVVDTSPAVS